MGRESEILLSRVRRLIQLGQRVPHNSEVKQIVYIVCALLLLALKLLLLFCRKISDNNKIFLRITDHLFHGHSYPRWERPGLFFFHFMISGF